MANQRIGKQQKKGICVLHSPQTFGMILVSHFGLCLRIQIIRHKSLRN